MFFHIQSFDIVLKAFGFLVSLIWSGSMLNNFAPLYVKPIHFNTHTKYQCLEILSSIDIFTSGLIIKASDSIYSIILNFLINYFKIFLFQIWRTIAQCSSSPSYGWIPEASGYFDLKQSSANPLQTDLSFGTVSR